MRFFYKCATDTVGYLPAIPSSVARPPAEQARRTGEAGGLTRQSAMAGKYATD
jgi:hypothetical protein